jgi:hydrogenase maturation protein HypF
MALERRARQDRGDSLSIYPFTMETDGTIRLGTLLGGVADDVLAGHAASAIAAQFHRTLAELIDQTVQHIRSTTHLNTVALSGGVFQNRLLAGLVRDQLTHSGFEVLEHRRVPANDGGLSLGQAVITAHLFSDPQ